jgi:protein-disulfide isomerase
VKTSKKTDHAHHEHKKTIKTEEVKSSRSSNFFAEPAKAYMVFSIVAMAVLIGVIIYLLTAGNSGSSGPKVNYNGDKVPVEFYVMSQCPYGTQVEDAIAPVLSNMEGAVDFKVNYIASETSPGVFRSLHGDKETKGNIVQLCAAKYNPDEYVDMIVCQNKDAANVDTNWESCARGLGMDVESIKSCYNSNEGIQLLSESIKISNAKGASASPTIYIGGQPYQGARDSVAFQRAICQFSDHPACSSIPACAADTDCTAEVGKEGSCTNPGKSDAKCVYTEPVKFELTVVTDDKCTTCDTSRIIQVSQQLFMGSTPRIVDVDSAEGQQLVAKYGIELLPTYVFDSKVTETKSWQSSTDLQSVFERESDGKYSLLPEVVGASYFVSEEARAAYQAEQDRLNAAKLDAVGVTKGDNKPQIDFFVMSYCPFGNQAEEGIEPVYQLLKDNAEFKPHYVIYSNYGGGGSDYCIANGQLCSMHGIQELNQNIREACVLRDNGIDAWFDFALAMNKQCSASNADSCWTNVAKGLGLDTAAISACQSKDGEALMRADFELGQTLGVQGSPTVFVEGIDYSGGRNAESFKSAMCAYYDNAPSECQTKLAGEVVASSNAGMVGCGV